MITAALVREKALDLGFDLVGMTPLVPGIDAQPFLDWLSAGHHGDMSYLSREDAVRKRLDPQRVLPGARTAILVAVSYEALNVPMEILTDPSRGRIARYAWGADYHDVLIPVLRGFGNWVSHESRAYADTGPVLERAWAERAGLGFIGKNTCLINPDLGSFVFLGAVFVAADLQEDDPPAQASRKRAACGCGGCTRCLTACPTRAFPRPGVLDARRCISYLTIEQKGAIPDDLRPLLGNWVFGCDICQDVCPYVRQYSRPSAGLFAQRFRPLDVDRAAPPLRELLSLDEEAFHARFGRTPLARAKWHGLLRNACVAAGNSGLAELLPLLHNLAFGENALVRDHAVWATRTIERSRPFGSSKN